MQVWKISNKLLKIVSRRIYAQNKILRRGWYKITISIIYKQRLFRNWPKYSDDNWLERSSDPKIPIDPDQSLIIDPNLVGYLVSFQAMVWLIQIYVSTVTVSQSHPAQSKVMLSVSKTWKTNLTEGRLSALYELCTRRSVGLWCRPSVTETRDARCIMYHTAGTELGYVFEWVQKK
jgi:hypothetical protein